ncbi:hypothetical protein PIB30_048405 [Stylosanthes scabra]|uniref:Uncharacterized protein n=1 Tax=Stylosanthes scabra TaxID=79078 RepID=A0ABU6QHJ1_9FABA|nr:hypothetical protein [Stylosanthes scabra]
MESLQTGSCLWVVTDQNLFGFRVGKLEQLGKHGIWHSKCNLSKLPFDFHLKLPDRDMCPFFLDSKLFFAGGSFNSIPLASKEIYQVSYGGGTTLDIAEVEKAAGTIPEPPTLLYDSYVTNIQGEVHLMCFTWKDKLFLMISRNPRKIKSPKDNFIFHVYNPQHDPEDYPWKQIEDPFSFCSNGYNPAIVAVPSLGKLGNCNVALAWTTEAYPHEYLKLSLIALLVDNDDNCVRHQCLDELSDMIPSYFIRSTSLDVNFVDLGEGKVCVLIGGDTAEYRQANQSFVC